MKINQITFSRFIIAILIVIYHYGLNIYPYNNSVTYFIVKNANVGPSYFYLLSGFVMMIAYGNKSDLNFLNYIKNRFARIYPVYLLSLLLIVIHYLFSGQMHDYNGLFLNVFLVQSWIPGKAISFHAPGWSISVEFFFYFLFPILLSKIYYKYEKKKILFVVILCWILSQILFNYFLYSKYYQPEPSKIHDFFFYFPLMHLSTFLIGNVLGLYFLKMGSDKFKNYDVSIVIITLLILFFLKFPFGMNFHNGLLSFLFVPFILLMSLNTGKITDLFNKKVFVYLGEISFGLYILQYPVILWTKSVLKHFNLHNDAVILTICIGVLLVASSISYTFFETPLRNRLKKMF